MLPSVQDVHQPVPILKKKITSPSEQERDVQTLDSMVIIMEAATVTTLPRGRCSPDDG